MTVELTTNDGVFTLTGAWLDRSAWAWTGKVKSGATCSIPIADCRLQRMVADEHGLVKRSRR